jgi:hypothetical protein
LPERVPRAGALARRLAVKAKHRVSLSEMAPEVGIDDSGDRREQLHTP